MTRASRQYWSSLVSSGAHLCARAGATIRGIPRTGRSRKLTQGSLFFIVNNRNHVRILAPIAIRLRELSLTCDFADIERQSGDRGARKELARFGLVSTDLEQLMPAIGPGDIMVVANDWYPDEVTAAMRHCEGQEILRIGIMEGCHFALPDRYQRVNHVLAWGPSSLSVFADRARVVGSPIIEAAWRRSGSFAAPGFAIVNYKFGGNAPPERRENWLLGAIRACQAVGLSVQVSRHPSNSDPLNVPLADREFRDLLVDASVVVSRPSTVLLESMAAGKPVVLYPDIDDGLLEFGEPRGAFDIARSSMELTAALQTALAEKETYRDRCKSFFEFHVSIDPQLSAIDRIVEALIELRNVQVSVRPSRHD
jgi:hypothetical protein